MRTGTGASKIKGSTLFRKELFASFLIVDDFSPLSRSDSSVNVSLNEDDSALITLGLARRCTASE